MSTADAADAVVVGAGVIGSAVALALADRGHRVVLAGAVGTEGTASTAAGAMLGALGEVTADEAARADRDRDVALRLRAADRYPAWIDELADLAGVRPAGGLGTFVVAGSRAPHDTANLAAIGATAARFGRRFEELGADQVPGWRPAAAYPGGRALYLPDEGWVEAPGLLDALARATLNSHAVRPYATTVAEVVLNGDRAVGVRTTGGEILYAPAVVLAAGCHTQTILDATPGLTGRFPRIVPGKGVGLTYRRPAGALAPDAVIRTPNREFACGLHLVPRGGGAYVGATNRVAGGLNQVGAATGSELRYLLERATDELDTGLAGWRVARVATGNRPISTDGRPLVGRTDVDGLYLATGTYRNGILLAPVVADIVADEIDAGAASVANPYPAQGRTPPTIPAAAVLRAGVGELAGFITGSDGPAMSIADLEPVLAALFDGVLEPAGAGAAIRALIEDTLAATPIPEILPELLARLTGVGAPTADRFPQETR